MVVGSQVAVAFPSAFFLKNPAVVRPGAPPAFPPCRAPPPAPPFWFSLFAWTDGAVLFYYIELRVVACLCIGSLPVAGRTKSQGGNFGRNKLLLPFVCLLVFSQEA